MAERPVDVPDGFTTATVVAAEGQRVGLVTCLVCGCALVLDGREPTAVMDLHRRWHGRVR